MGAALTLQSVTRVINRTHAASTGLLRIARVLPDALVIILQLHDFAEAHNKVFAIARVAQRLGLFVVPNEILVFPGVLLAVGQILRPWSFT